jgi:glycosyltransferase involved in cell wall biosynthesis
MRTDDREYLKTTDITTLAGHDMVYFGPTQWDGLWRNRHQLMSRFARCNKVMYVEPVKTWRKLIGKKQSWQNTKTSILKGPVRTIDKNLYIYNSLLPPIIGRYPFGILTWALWRAKFRSTLQNLGFKKPIIWLSYPTMGHFIDLIGPKLSIYHVVDEYSEYLKANKKKMLEWEKQIFGKADIVIVVSEKLLKAKKKYHSNVHLIPNGVDFDKYEAAIKSSNDVPEDISGLHRPILGYSGLISYRLDLNLIKKTARKFPEWSIVLIGTIDDRGCEDEIAQLLQIPNVYFLGMKPIDLVPHYIVAFDASIIPYSQNGEVENLSPLKLYDAMAAGKPVVTTDFPAAHEFKDLIYINDTHDQFIRSIELALCETDESKYHDRIHAASENTWDDRITQISKIIAPLV